MAAVVVDRTEDAVVDETEVKTEVPCAGGLPLDVVVVAVGAIGLIPLVAELVGRFGIGDGVGCHPGIVVDDILLAGLAVAHA